MDARPAVQAIALFALLLFSLVVPSSFSAIQSSDVVVQQQETVDELLVKFRPSTSTFTRQSVHRALGTSALTQFASVPELQVVKLPPGAALQQKLAEFRAMDQVLYAEPNYRMKPLAIPNDTLFGQLWGLRNTGQTGGVAGADIGAAAAWDLTTGSHDVVIGHIDSGVDYNHPDLASNIYRNEADCNSNGRDDDGNGYVDDCFGIDTFSNDSDPMDEIIHSHGTHVAGVLGAIGNNGVGVVGVNWNVRILPCRFIGTTDGPTSAAIACLEYMQRMKDRGVNIVAINASWGGDGNSISLRDAIDRVRQRGILFITAAGNSAAEISSHIYPCNYDLSTSSASAPSIMPGNVHRCRISGGRVCTLQHRERTS